MALFKISRGGEKNLPTAITDGWAYFTPDTKNFFIDVNNTVAGNSFNERIQINEKPIIIRKQLLLSDWDTSLQQLVVSVDEKITGMWYTLEVQPINITFNIASVLAKSNISYELAGSTVIFKYAGQKPVTHIDVEMIFTPKERRLEYFSLSRAGSVFSGGPDHLCFYDGCTWDEWCEYGVALNNLYAIDKKSESKIRVYGTMTKYFEFSVGGIKPHTGTYDVSFAQGYGSAEPE